MLFTEVIFAFPDMTQKTVEILHCNLNRMIRLQARSMPILAGGL
jgi:hypothetical protein